MNGMESALYRCIPHPHIAGRKTKRPAKVDDERVGINGKVGLFITAVVGTMWVAYLFTIVALISLPQAINSGDTIIIIGWIAQTFLQLVLLPVIIVGQNIQAKGSDKRAEQTYEDAEAVLHECQALQEHRSRPGPSTVTTHQQGRGRARQVRLVCPSMPVRHHLMLVAYVTASAGEKCYPTVEVAADRG